MAGLLDSIGQGLTAANGVASNWMNSPLFALGSGLIQGAQPFQNVGLGIQNARGTQLQQQGQQVQNAQGLLGLGLTQMQMQMLQQQMPILMGALSNIGGLMGGPAGGGAAPSSGAAAPQGVPNIPQMPSSLTQPMTGAPGPQAAAPQPGAPQPQGGAPQQGGIPDIAGLARVGTLLSVSPLTKDIGASVLKSAELLANTDPRLLTQKAVATNQYTQDAALVAQAAQSGDQQALQAAKIKFWKDTGQLNVANNQGAVTLLGGLKPSDVGLSTFNPSQGTQTSGGVETPIPGAAPTEKALAAAKAGGESGAEYAPVFDSKGNQIGFAPRASILSQMPPAGPAPPGGTAPPAPGTGANFGLSPEAHAQGAAAGTAAGSELTELNNNAAAARQANYTLDQLRQLGHSTSLGPAAPVREWTEQVATPLAQAFGMKPPAELGNYEQINKFGNQLAFAASRAMGSREAAQIVQLQIQSNPNKGLVGPAYYGLIDSMSAMNNYVIAKNAAVQGAATGGQISARQAQANWETKIDPTVWDLGISPDLASRFAGKIGAAKITTALPFMSSDDAVGVMRNIPAALQAQVLRGLPPAAKQEILSALQQLAQTGATGTY